MPQAAPSRRRTRRRGHARGFTLVELLVTISIIAILASVLLGTLFFSAEKARDARTRAMITRLDQAITIRWETYRTRRVPVDVEETALALGAGLDSDNPHHVALIRLLVLRELMRMELPDRWADVFDPPAIPTLARPAISNAYFQWYSEIGPNDLNQGPECLYMIVTMGGMGDDAVVQDHFRSADVGDTDEDGAPEFLDGWGRPIRFLRWAPGFVSELQPDADATTVDDPSTPEVEGIERDVMNNHDPFDPLKCDLPESMLMAIGGQKFVGLRTTENPFAGFRLFPLIYSSGPDGVPDIRGDFLTTTGVVNYSTTVPPNDPYYDGDPANSSLDRWIGSVVDIDNDGLNNLDNIHNHILGGSVR